MRTGRFGKVLTAMVTPFQQDGSLDVDGTARLARWLVEHGNDGLVLAGTTGEAPTLTADETVTLWETVRGAVDVPLLAGVGSNNTSHTIEMAQRAATTGVDALLVVSPYYNKPPQAGIDRHMRMVAAVTDLPIVMYDVPHRTSRAMTVETIVRLAQEVPTIAAIKDARGNPLEAAHIVAETPDDFELYSGDDGLTLPLLAVGAVGVVGVSTHWTAGFISEMIAAFAKGEHDTAREINARMLASFAYQSTELWQAPTAVKAVLDELGLPGGPCRPPLTDRLPDEGRARAREIITTLELRP